MTVCAACGTENPGRAKFCLECGAALAAAAAREERKVVTCLFCDLVGFTSRAERLDPEEVRALLVPYHAHVREVLERHGGTVEKFIGDAVMAVFGAPLAHEDDPERAVRAALEIRGVALEDGFAVRIAVNTGEALVSLGADPRAGEAIAAGDVVNTAARLQAAAPVNGILVGETTYRATRHVIDYREAKAVEAKGKARPVPAWAAVEARSPFGVDVRQHGAAPLVGRQRELELLLAAFDRAVAEREPQLVTLVGVPGIGKSRLLWELFQALDARPESARWRQGRCLPYGSGSAFWALGEIVKAHAGVLEDDGAEATAAKLAAAASGVPADERGWVESHLRALVGLEADGGRERAESFAAWRRLLEAVAEEMPLVLVFEDLHWADDALLDFVDHLADWAAGVPILVVCSARPELLERRPGWGGGKLNALVLALSPLGEDETARLLAAVLNRTVLPAEAQAALLQRAGGNPLYAEQFAQLYRESGGVEDLPEGVQGIIAARLDGLPPEEKELLQGAAVFGKVFWAGALEALGRDDVQTLLHSLERKEFVRRERRASIAGEAEYAFRHILVRDVAYGQIPRAERAGRHEAAARWIESLGRSDDHAEVVAHHYATALELARAAGREAPELVELARRSLRDAAARAAAMNAFPRAVALYRGALELWPADDLERPHLLFGLGRARLLVEQAGAEELREAADGLLAAGRPELAAEAEVWIGELAWYGSRGDVPEAQLARALELVEPLPDSPSKARVMNQAARLAMLAGRFEEAVAYAGRADAVAEALDLPDVRVQALNFRGTARASVGDDGGLDELRESVALARELNSPELGRSLNNLAVALNQRGRTRESDAVSREALAAAERFGLAAMAFHSKSNWVLDLYRQGRLDEAARLADELVAEADASGGRFSGLSARLGRAVLRLARGDLRGALEDSGRGLDVGRRDREPQSRLPALAIRARVLAEAGERDEARSLVEELLDVARSVDFAFAGSPEVVGPGALLVGAERFFDALAARWRTPWLDALEELLLGDPDRAVALYEAMESPADVAYARLCAAQAHAAAGRRAAADAHLHAALAFYRSVGATRYVREGEALLAAAG